MQIVSGCTPAHSSAFPSAAAFLSRGSFAIFLPTADWAAAKFRLLISAALAN